MSYKRVFIIVLDSFGIGGAKDAKAFGDEGANTLKSVSKSEYFKAENLRKSGLFNICGVVGEKAENPDASYFRMSELSKGKDTTTGHWEIAGLVSKKPFPTYPNGFPENILEKFYEETGYRAICNKPYSGTDVIRDYYHEHIGGGGLIVYTSADSVFQIAAHESVISAEELYEVCKKARKLLCGEHSVARVIARPFYGEYPNLKRSEKRHDFSLEPWGDTFLDRLAKKGYDTIAVGKIYDIFAGKGIGEYVFTKNNKDGIKKTFEYIDKDFSGVCFVNLVDFDMLYGHRRDKDGYAKAISEFDDAFGRMKEKLKEDDLLIITADHGCDPCYSGTDHTREDVPVIIWSKKIKAENMGEKEGFYHVGKLAEDWLLMK